MQLNDPVVRSVRNIRAFWVALIFALAGLFFIIMGIVFFVSPQDKNFEKATATITDIRSEVVVEEEVKYVIISYQDKTGLEHTDIRLDAYDTSWNIGSQITIKYNPNDPTEVKTDTPAIVFLIMFEALGLIAFISSIFTIVATIKRVKRKPVDIENQADA